MTTLKKSSPKRKMWGNENGVKFLPPPTTRTIQIVKKSKWLMTRSLTWYLIEALTMYLIIQSVKRCPMKYVMKVCMILLITSVVSVFNGSESASYSSSGSYIARQRSLKFSEIQFISNPRPKKIILNDYLKMRGIESIDRENGRIPLTYTCPEHEQSCMKVRCSSAMINTWPISKKLNNWDELIQSNCEAC